MAAVTSGDTDITAGIAVCAARAAKIAAGTAITTASGVPMRVRRRVGGMRGEGRGLVAMPAGDDLRTTVAPK